MLFIIMEEREGSARTVGWRQSTSLSPTDTNLLSWRDLVLICLLLLDRLKYILVAHLVDLKFLLVTDRTRALVMPHTTSKVSERGHFILPELNLSFFHFLFSIINVKACKTLCLEGSVCATDLYWSKNHIFGVFISEEILTLVVFAQKKKPQNLNPLQVCRCTWNASIS